MANQPDYEYDLYAQEFGRLRSLQEKNLINQDNALIQLSVGLLAVLATFGTNIIKANKTLGVIVSIFLGMTILQVVVGYYLSNMFFKVAQQKLTDNYLHNVNNPNASQRKLNEGVEEILSGKANTVLNVTSYISFILAIGFFFVLLMIYVRGLR